MAERRPARRTTHSTARRTAPAAASSARTGENALAVKRSGLRVGLLTIVSLGLYQLYWFYVTRQRLDEELGADRAVKYSPGLQTFGPLLVAVIGTIVSIPLMLILVGFILLPVAIIAAVVVGVLVWYYLMVDLNKLRRKAGLSEFSIGLYILGYVVLGMINLGFTSGAVIMNIILNQNVNEYLDKSTNGKAVEAPYTSGEILVSVIGALLIIAMIILFIILAAAGVFDSSNFDSKTYTY